MTQDLKANFTLKAVSVSSATFVFFQIYQLDFFLHTAARIDALGVLRPSFLLFGIIAFLLYGQREKFKYKLDHPIFKSYGMFLIMLPLALPFVTYPGSVIKANIPEFIKAIVFLYFTALILDSESRLKKALIVFVGCQVFRVLEPVFLHITQGYWGSSTYMGNGEFASRLSGAPSDVINPNELGFVIVTCIPFLHYFLSNDGWKKKVLYVGLLAVLFYALILTMSRGAFLALLVVGWMVFLESKRKILIVVAFLCIIVAAWSVMNDVQRDRYFSLVSSDSKQSATAEGRLRGSQDELLLGLKRPFFGFGLGTAAEAKFNNGQGREASHNMYAEILIEVGFVGMFLFFRFIKSIYSQLRFSLKKIQEIDVFYERAFNAFKVVFWMFVVYSSNYWGLNQYYWYNLAGLIIAAAFLSKSTMTYGRSA